MAVLVGTYAISTTSNGLANEDNLHAEMLALALTSCVYKHLGRVGTDVKVYTDVAPSGADKTTIDNAIMAHDGTASSIVGDGSALTVSTGAFPTEQSIWTKVIDGMMIFPGSTVVTISGAKISAYMDAGPTSYDLRVIDVSNGDAVIVSILGQTNQTPMTWTELTPVVNIPLNAACFELQVRRNGGSAGEKVYVEAWMLELT